MYKTKDGNKVPVLIIDGAIIVAKNNRKLFDGLLKWVKKCANEDTLLVVMGSSDGHILHYVNKQACKSRAAPFVEVTDFRQSDCFVVTDNETVTLPALTQQKAPKHLYDNYLAFCNDKDTDAAGESFLSISHGMFYEILTKITSGGEKMLTAVELCDRSFSERPSDIVATYCG